MTLSTDNVRNAAVVGETVRAFLPTALPQAGPPLRVNRPIDAASTRTCRRSRPTKLERTRAGSGTGM